MDKPLTHIRFGERRQIHLEDVVLQQINVGTASVLDHVENALKGRTGILITGHVAQGIAPEAGANSPVVLVFAKLRKKRILLGSGLKHMKLACWTLTDAYPIFTKAFEWEVDYTFTSGSEHTVNCTLETINVFLF